MAQYFYDMSVGKNGEWPALLKGVRPDLSTAGMRSIGYGKNVLTNEPCVIFDKSSANIWNAVGLGVDLSDFEVVLHFSMNRVTDSQNFINVGGGLFLRRGGGIGSDGDGYYVVFGTMSSDNYRSASLYRLGTGGIPGSQVSLQTVSANGFLSGAYSLRDSRGQPRFLRVNVSGRRIRARAWWKSEAEPTNWPIDFTDTDTGWTHGDIALHINGYEQLWNCFFISVGTNGDPAPLSLPGGPRVVAGVVRDPLGVAVGEGYIVRCYHRASGAVLGETLTNLSGAYSFEVNLMQSEEIYCLAIDNLGNNWGIPTVDRPVS